MASEIKVNKISPESGTTLTLGDSGDTINFGSGVLPNFENLTVTGDLTVDTNSLKVDSANNFVGIGTASPSVALDVVGAITASGNITGTLATAAQPNITSVGTLTGLTVNGTASATTFSGSGASLTTLNADNLSSGTVPSARISGAYTGITQTGTLTSFASTGIDDNATSTSLTIASDGRTTLDATNEKALVVHHSDGSNVRIGMNNNSTNSNEIAFESTDFVVKPGGFEKFRIDSLGNTLINTTSAKGDDASTFAPVLTVNGGSYDGLIEVAGNRSDADGAGVARLQFIQNSNSATYKEVAEIRVETEGATANQRGGRINFRTRANGSTSTTEQMRIDSSGNVMVGTTDSTPASSSSGSGISLRENGSIEASRDGSAPLFLNRQTSDGKIIDLYKDGTTVGSIGANGGDLVIHSTASGHEGLRFGNGAIVPVGSTGASTDNETNLGGATGRFSNFYLAGGIYLGGTGSANKLDDYEEGTWTPTFSHGISSISYGTQSGRYTKIGDIVYFDLSLQTTGGSGVNTRLRIGGFPFTAVNSSAGHASIGYTDNALINSTSTNLPTLFTEPSTLDFYNSGGGQFVGTDLNDPTSINIYISGFRKVN